MVVKMREVTHGVLQAPTMIYLTPAGTTVDMAIPRIAIIHLLMEESPTIPVLMEALHGVQPQLILVETIIHGSTVMMMMLHMVPVAQDLALEMMMDLDLAQVDHLMMIMILELRKQYLEKNVFSPSLMMEPSTMTAQLRTLEISHGVQQKLAIMTTVSLSGIIVKLLVHLHLDHLHLDPLILHTVPLLTLMVRFLSTLIV